MPHINLSSPRTARPASIGLRVRKARRDARLTQADLAKAAGIGRRTVQRVEGGELPAFDTVRRLEHALKLAPGSLVPGWDQAASLHKGYIGARLREQRQKLGITLVKLGSYVGASAAKLSRMERGIPRRAQVFDDLIDYKLFLHLGFRNEVEFSKWLAYDGPDFQPRYG